MPTVYLMQIIMPAAESEIGPWNLLKVITLEGSCSKTIERDESNMDEVWKTTGWRHIHKPCLSVISHRNHIHLKRWFDIIWTNCVHCNPSPHPSVYLFPTRFWWNRDFLCLLCGPKQDKSKYANDATLQKTRCCWGCRLHATLWVNYMGFLNEIINHGQTIMLFQIVIVLGTGGDEKNDYKMAVMTMNMVSTPCNFLCFNFRRRWSWKKKLKLITSWRNFD